MYLAVLWVRVLLALNVEMAFLSVVGHACLVHLHVLLVLILPSVLHVLLVIHC